MISYTIYLCILFWNFAWTYDIYLTVNYPLMFTEKFVFYYKIGVYFTALIIGLVVFFPFMGSFTSTDTFQCFIKNGWVFNIFVNAPSLLFILVNLFVNVVFARKNRYRGYAQNSYRIS